MSGMTWIRFSTRYTLMGNLLIEAHHEQYLFFISNLKLFIFCIALLLDEVIVYLEKCHEPKTLTKKGTKSFPQQFRLGPRFFGWCFLCSPVYKHLFPTKICARNDITRLCSLERERNEKMRLNIHLKKVQWRFCSWKMGNRTLYFHFEAHSERWWIKFRNRFRLLATLLIEQIQCVQFCASTSFNATKSYGSDRISFPCRIHRHIAPVIWWIRNWSNISSAIVHLFLIMAYSTKIWNMYISIRIHPRSKNRLKYVRFMVNIWLFWF